jgi:hypothetical protein
MNTMGEKEKRLSKKNMDGRSTSSQDNKEFRTTSMGNREEWCLVSRRQLQLLKKLDK